MASERRFKSHLANSATQPSPPGLISAQDLSFSYTNREAISKVAINTRENTLTALIGPNGCGKSTLLKCLYGLLQPDGGTVFVAGRSLGDWSVGEVAKHIGVVPQDAASPMGLTVIEAVLLGRNPHRQDHQGYSQADKLFAADALKQVGAFELASRRLGELSGGERQRVGIARCLAQNTKTLLLDEPTNHLDIRYQHEVLQLVQSLCLETIVVLHDLNLAARFCERVVLMNKGEVVAVGTVDEVLTPEVLEPVYEIPVDRVSLNGVPVLVFGHRS